MSLLATSTTPFSGLPRPTILDREAAEGRLSAVRPGTDEHVQLSSALRKTSGIAEICLPHQTYKVCVQKDRLLGGFGASEHFFIAEGIKLCELEDKALLHRGDVSISFEHIIALAGDFYGVPNEPISLLGGSDQAKEARFMAAFATLENANPEQLGRLVVEVEQEYHRVSNSGAPHHCYSSRLVESNGRFNEIKGDIGDLLVDNSDHFAGNAREAYSIGHLLACREAVQARQSQDKERLKRAYAIEAFACHFLTDLFAAGHIRNCRGPLEVFLHERLGFSPECSKPLSAILTGAQHEYDGERGLEVFIPEQPNALWRAYGDGFFFTPKNKVNQERAIQTVQQSVDEVTKAYKDGFLSPTQMMGRIPEAHKFNHDPLYTIQDGQLMIFFDKGPELIQNKKDYFLKAIPRAVGVLPEGDANGMLNGFFYKLLKNHGIRLELPPEVENILGVYDKIITPRIERFTGIFVNAIGIASCAQVNAIAERDATLTQELIDTAQATWKQGEQILGAVNQLAKQVEHLQLRFEMVPVKKAVGDIQTSFLKLRTFSQLDSQQLDHIRHTLWDAASQLMNIFLSVQENAKMFSDRSLLIAYAETQFPDRSPAEKRLEATRWFRQILRYQVAAFSTYLNLKYRRGGPEEAMQEIRIFQNHLVTQIEVNKDSIIPDVLYASDEYANVRQQAIEQQNAFQGFLENS